MDSVYEFASGFGLWRAVYILAFAACFVTMERLWPAVPTQRPWRRGSGTDLALSFLNPIVVAPVSSLLISALVTGLLNLVGYDYLESAQQRVGAWPLPLQVAAALLLGDLFGYWKHRVFHTRLLWPVHAVHHSAEEIDWLTNERDHPLQLLATYVAVVPPLVLAGFSPEVIALQAALRRAYSLYTHANVRWSYGFLSRVFVSPAFHRWHHAADATMAGKNFAVIFSFYDVLFGSYRLPLGEQPASFGLPDREALPSLVAMLRYPFRLPYRAA